jgi:hypothetical protein
MYGQFDLEMISNSSKNERRPSNFHEFWSEEVGYKQNLKMKKTLMFEHHYLDSIELGDVIF